MNTRNRSRAEHASQGRVKSGRGGKETGRSSSSGGDVSSAAEAQAEATLEGVEDSSDSGPAGGSGGGGAASSSSSSPPAPARRALACGGDDEDEDDHHPLPGTWCLWYQQKSKRAPGVWSEGITCVGRFNTVEGFWSIYSHMMRPSDIRGSVDIMVFRDGIQPMWEDPLNKEGGHLNLRIRKGPGSTLWETLLLAMIGETLPDPHNVCGAVFNVRGSDEGINLWYRDADDTASVEAQIAELTRLFHMPESLSFEIKLHSRRKAAEAAAAGSEGGGGDGSGAAGSHRGGEAAPLGTSIPVATIFSSSAASSSSASLSGPAGGHTAANGSGAAAAQKPVSLSAIFASAGGRAPAAAPGGASNGASGSAPSSARSSGATGGAARPTASSAGGDDEDEGWQVVGRR